MSKARKFDHDECRRLFATGRWTKAALARKYGVTAWAITFAVDARARNRNSLAVAERQSSGICIDCGGRKSHQPYKKGQPNLRCRACDAANKVTSVRDDGLKCFSCGEWKWDTEYPYDRTQNHRRDRHGTCRACHTKHRRAYREKRKVPCSHGCGRMVLHETAHGGPPSCHPCAMRAKRVAA